MSTIQWLRANTLVSLNENYDVHVWHVAVDGFTQLSGSSLCVKDIDLLVHNTYPPNVKKLSDDEDFEHGKLHREDTVIGVTECEEKLYFIGKQGMCVMTVPKWTKQMENLIDLGDYVEAIAFTTKYYNKAALPPSEKRRAQFLKQLKDNLLQFLVDQMGERSSKATGRTLSSFCSTTSIDVDDEEEEEEEDFEVARARRVAYEAFEYCYIIGEMRFFTGPVYAEFKAIGEEAVAGYMDVVIPHIMNERLRTLPAQLFQDVLQFLADHKDLKRRILGDLLLVSCPLFTKYCKTLGLLKEISSTYRLWVALCVLSFKSFSNFCGPIEIILDQITSLSKAQQYEAIDALLLCIQRVCVDGCAVHDSTVSLPPEESFRHCIDVWKLICASTHSPSVCKYILLEQPELFLSLFEKCFSSVEAVDTMDEVSVIKKGFLRILSDAVAHASRADCKDDNRLQQMVDVVLKTCATGLTSSFFAAASFDRQLLDRVLKLLLEVRRTSSLHSYFLSLYTFLFVCFKT